MSIMKRFTEWLKRRTFGDWVFAGLAILALILRGPVFVEHFQKEGKKIVPVSLEGNLLPPPGEKAVLVFWATWCGPCTVELSRISSAIAKGEISSRHLYAVNMGEDRAVIERTMAEKKYQFQVVRDTQGELASKLGVSATPTIAFIDRDSTVKWLSSGLSPTLIFRISHFQKN